MRRSAGPHDRMGAGFFWANLAIGLALSFYIFYGWGGLALELLRRSPSLAWLLSFLALAAATVVLLSWRWGFVLRVLDPPPRVTALALHRSAAHGLGVLVPSAKLGGDPLRVWLGTRAGVPASSAIAAVVADRALEMGAAAPFSLFFAAHLLQRGVPQIEQAFLAVAVGTVGLGAGVGIALYQLHRSRGLISGLVRALGVDRFRFIGARMGTIEASELALQRLAARPRRMFAALAVGIVANLLVFAELTCLLAAFDLPSDATAVIAALFATAAAHMAPIPAGVGVLEGAQMWLFQMLGYPAEVGLAVALAVRGRELLWMVPGVAYLLLSALAPGRDRVRA